MDENTRKLIIKCESLLDDIYNGVCINNSLGVLNNVQAAKQFEMIETARTQVHLGNFADATAAADDGIGALVTAIKNRPAY